MNAVLAGADEAAGIAIVVIMIAIVNEKKTAATRDNNTVKTLERTAETEGMTPLQNRVQLCEADCSVVRRRGSGEAFWRDAYVTEANRDSGFAIQSREVGARSRFIPEALE